MTGSVSSQIHQVFDKKPVTGCLGEGRVFLYRGSSKRVRLIAYELGIYCTNFKSFLNSYYYYWSFSVYSSALKTLSWTWAKKEVIWSMMGDQATEQGHCSKYKTSPPHCCKKTPCIVDLLPGTPYNQQLANCCKGGAINSCAQEPNNYASSFQLSVGAAGTTNKTVKPPKNFTLLAPGPGYTCGPAVVGKPSKFISADGRQVTQAMMTWNVTCTYSQFQKAKMLK